MVLFKNIPMFVVCKCLQKIKIKKILIKSKKFSFFSCIHQNFEYNGDCPKGRCISYHNIPRYTYEAKVFI